MQNFKDRGQSQEAKFANDQADSFRKRAAAVRELGAWAEEVAPVNGAGDRVIAAGVTSTDAQLIALTADLTAKPESEVAEKFAALRA